MGSVKRVGGHSLVERMLTICWFHHGCQLLHDCLVAHTNTRLPLTSFT